jgi:exosortase
MTVEPLASSEARLLAFDRAAQVKTAVVVALFIAAFWHLLSFIPPLGWLTYSWVYEADWSHGPLIPVFSAYLVYHRWDRIRRCPVRHTWVGAVLLALGLALYVWSLTGLLFAYAKALAMMVTLLGLLIFLLGLPALWYLWLPWLYLFFAYPLPSRLYFAWTTPLRRIAAEVAAAVLSLTGLHIERVGANLEYIYRGVSGNIGVADACSGMRSTVTLCALGVAVACMSDRPLWHRIILVLACVPIATFCNFIRVTTTCWLHVYVDPKYATGDYHMMLGLAIIVLAFGIFSGLGWILNRLVVEEEAADDEPADRPAPPAAQGTHA